MNGNHDLSRANWFKSSYSNGQGGACVEVAANLPGIVAVRDSKNRSQPELTVPDQAWSDFTNAIKRGEFSI